MLPVIEQNVCISLASGSRDIEHRVASILSASFHARPLGCEGEWLVFGVGSRVMFRIWGLWGPRAYRRLPLKVRVRVSGDEHRKQTLELNLVNDEGWYAVRLPILEPAYRRAYREILDCLQSAFESK